MGLLTRYVVVMNIKGCIVFQSYMAKKLPLESHDNSNFHNVEKISFPMVYHMSTLHLRSMGSLPALLCSSTIILYDHMMPFRIMDITVDIYYCAVCPYQPSPIQTTIITKYARACTCTLVDFS